MIIPLPVFSLAKNERDAYFLFVATSDRKAGLP